MPVRFRGKRVPSVFCPRKLKALATTDCGRCEYGQGLSFDIERCSLFMNCGWPPDALHLPSDGETSDTTLASLITRPVHFVDQDAELDSVLPAFLNGGVDAAVVVDSQARVAGILSKTDLLHWHYRDSSEDAARSAITPTAVERSATPRVREAMSHLVYMLSAEADIPRAAALMAYEGVHQIVVTDRDRRPIGMLSSLDILRCIARRNGYVMSEAG